MTSTSNSAAKPVPPQMPYMDGMLEHIAQGDSQADVMWGRHLHWGYWDDPSTADGTAADFAAAAERLTQLVLDAAQITDGMRVIDCGCGIGGAVASLNERFSDVRLTGVNIDERQLAVARERVQARPGNEVDFVHADACDLPFESESADAVIAVECIFHFPSRRRFLREARRVLRPGGRLALTDCVPVARALPVLARPRAKMTFYGQMNQAPTPVFAYKILARALSMRIRDKDITLGTLPTYDVVRDWADRIGPEGREHTDLLGELFRRGQVRYRLMSFEKL